MTGQIHSFQEMPGAESPRDALRNSGIDIIGEVPWGTHFCMFYSSKEDLLDILVPFFRAGLENGECCVWVTSKPFTKAAAKKVMRNAIPGFDDCLKKGQIDILAHDEWYVRGGVFNSDRVINGWVERYNTMREKGFSGLRITGNTFWLEKENWQDFMYYEEAINHVIGQYRMLVLCTYSLDRCGAAEILDVARTHEFVLANKGNRWSRIENAEIRQTKEALYRNNQKLEILSHTAALLLKSNNPQAVVEDLCRKVMEFLDCQAFFNYLVDEDRSCLRLNACSGVPEETAKRMEWLPYGEAVSGCAARDACNIVAENIQDTHDPRTGLIRSLGIKAYACHLLTAEDRVMGTLAFGARTRSDFSPDDLSMMKTVADQVAIAIMRIQTERDLRRTGEQLMQASRQWEDTFDSISDPISIHDEEFRIVRANKAFARIVGMKPEEFLGRKCHELIHGFHEPWPSCPHGQCMAGREPVTEEFLEPRIGKYLLVSCSPIAEQNNKFLGTVHVIKDITDRNRYLEELKIRKAELESANAELESFSYTVSHDLRAPLRAIDGFGKMLLRDIGEKLDPESLRKFNVIINNADKMGRLIDDLLSYSRTGRAFISFGRIEMEPLVRDIWKELQAGNPERNMELKVSSLPKASGDRTLVRQVLSNLLGNAVKFTRGRECAVIEVSGSGSGRFNTYYIKDNGAGFDMRYHDRMFEIFRRLHSEKDYEGTGLGLAIVKKIIEKHDGRVWGEGTPGQGATFCFTLPSLPDDRKITI